MLKLIRFGFTGALGTAVHIAVALVMVSHFDWALPQANVLAYVAALLFSYTGHSLWVFRHRLSLRRFLRFTLVNSASLIVITVLSWLADAYQVNRQLAVLLIACAVALLSFWLHNRITFAALSPAAEPKQERV